MSKVFSGDTKSLTHVADFLQKNYREIEIRTQLRYGN